MSAPPLRCWNCGADLTAVPRPISRHEHCPACFEALHCCRLCSHYQPDATISCDEERADPPVNKENANFCDFFRPRSGAYAESRGSRSAAARAGLDALFGNESDVAQEPEDPAASAEGEADEESREPLSKADAAKAKLDELFSKGDRS